MIINLNDYPNLANLLSLPSVTDKPIMVEDVDTGETYDITHIILAAYEELDKG